MTVARHPVLPKRAETGETLTVPDPVRGRLARDDVVYVTDGETLRVNVPAPGVRKTLDTIRREHKIKIKWAVLELHEVLAPHDLVGLVRAEGESQLDEGRHHRLSVLGRFLDEDVRILGRVRKSKQNGAGLAEKKGRSGTA
jgi:hypothetical protein